LKKTIFYKKRKIFIDQIIDVLEKNEDYKKFVKTDERYKEMMERNDQLTIWGVTFFDTYDNKGINKLVKGISKLNKGKYDVDLTLRPKRFKDLNYLNLQYDHTSTASLAKVKFLDDMFIREITSSFAQINNNQIVVEYEIYFNKIMNNKMLLDFIKNNKDILYRKSFIKYYDLDRIIDSKKFDGIYWIFEKLVISAFQAKLLEVIKLNFGKKYKLPSCLIINYPEGLYNKKYFRDVFLSETYEINDGEQYLIISKISQEGLEMELYFSGSTYKPLSFTHFISMYRMNFYYLLFDQIESYVLNQKMNKYFNESKNSISSKDYKWLVNKIRAINDNRLLRNHEKTYKKELKKWKAFCDGKEIDLAFSNNLYIKKYEIIYNECLEHVKIVYVLQKENLIIKIASSTLIATLLGIFIAIVIAIFMR
jgi:hypothetical protein